MTDLAAELPAALVFTAADNKRVARGLRAFRREPVAEIVALSSHTVCVALDDPPSERLRDRIARKVRGSAELRLDCDVAWAAMGRGYVLLIVSQPASMLDTVLESHGPSYREVSRPSNQDAPVRVCFPRLAVADPLVVAADLRAAGLRVEAVYEVGACSR